MSLPRFANAAAMVAALRPVDPVYALRPHVLTARARDFVGTFPGDVLYAVKCNPDPVVIEALWAGGIRQFDTASMVEIETVKALHGDAGCHFMHPVKGREAITKAYHAHCVRSFVVDHPDELTKIAQATGHASDVLIMVRLATARGAAVYDLGGKFGCTVDQAAELMVMAKGLGLRCGIAFHVGSQCMTPRSFTAALSLVAETVLQSGVEPAVIDVGGGFPAPYVGLQPPPLSAFVEAIAKGLKPIRRPADCALWCEPGRGLVAGGASLIARVELRRGNQLYLNDGIYGSLLEMKVSDIQMPMRVIRKDGSFADGGAVAPFGLFGPTCDCIDHLPGPFPLASDVGEGDYIEIGQVGAYAAATRTGFNGFNTLLPVVLEDAAFLPRVPTAGAHAAE